MFFGLSAHLAISAGEICCNFSEVHLLELLLQYLLLNTSQCNSARCWLILKLIVNKANNTAVFKAGVTDALTMLAEFKFA